MIEIVVAIKICLKTKFRFGIDVLSKGIDSIIQSGVWLFKRGAQRHESDCYFLSR